MQEKFCGAFPKSDPLVNRAISNYSINQNLTSTNFIHAKGGGKMTWMSWLIIGVIAALFAVVVAREIRNRKQGKGSCSCGSCGGSCGGCAMSGVCHAGKNEPPQSGQ